MRKKKLMHSDLTTKEEGTIPEEISEEDIHHKTEVVVTEETSEEGTQEVEDNNPIINLRTTNRTKSTPQRGGHFGQRGGNTQNHNGQLQNSGKWCANCRKPTHNTAQCWTKKKVNPVEEDENHQDQENSQQDEREYEEAVHSVFNLKN